MKKYNLSEIMKAAWATKHRYNRMSFSECLRNAWNKAKIVVQNAAAAMVTKFANGMEITVDGYTRTLTRWTKGNYDRIYINGGSRLGDGFVDLKNRTTSLRGQLTYQTKMANIILAMEF